MLITILRLRAHLLLVILEALERWQGWVIRLAEQDVRRLKMQMWRAQARGHHDYRRPD